MLDLLVPVFMAFLRSSDFEGTRWGETSKKLHLIDHGMKQKNLQSFLPKETNKMPQEKWKTGLFLLLTADCEPIYYKMGKWGRGLRRWYTFIVYDNFGTNAFCI